VAFSCKGRGFCPSCGGRRTAETAALLVDEVLPRVPIPQWVLSLPFALRYLLATGPEEVTRVLAIVYRAISGHLIQQAGLTRASGTVNARHGERVSGVRVDRAIPDQQPDRPLDQVSGGDGSEGRAKGVHAAELAAGPGSLACEGCRVFRILSPCGSLGQGRRATHSI
jgi:hypothetical protein